MLKSIVNYGFCALVFFPSFAMASERYNNKLPTCEELGYDAHTAVSTQALFCPFGNSYSVNIDNSCLGFVLKEELDADYAAYGRPEQFCELETCVQGQGNSRRTLYRCKQCKTSAFEAGLCVEFCDTKKFPYSKRPEDLYGTVIECKDVNGTRYAFSSCNNGWKMDANGVRCDMEICDRNYYPYAQEPDSRRGAYESFKSATNLYYGYKKDSCNSGYEFKSFSDDAATGLCVKKCAVSNCRLVSTSSEGIHDYKCDLPNDCVEGDSIYYNDTQIGILWHKADAVLNRNLVIAPLTGAPFGMFGLHYSSPSYSDGKLNTKKILEFCKANNSECPAAEYCNNYSVSGVSAPAFAKGQWYLGSRDETAYVFNINLQYIYAVLNRYSLNAFSIMTSHSANADRLYLWHASQNYSWVAWGTGKQQYGRFFPMLAI